MVGPLTNRSCFHKEIFFQVDVTIFTGKEVDSSSRTSIMLHLRTCARQNTHTLHDGTNDPHNLTQIDSPLNKEELTRWCRELTPGIGGVFQWFFIFIFISPFLIDFLTIFPFSIPILQVRLPLHYFPMFRPCGVLFDLGCICIVPSSKPLGSYHQTNAPLNSTLHSTMNILVYENHQVVCLRLPCRMGSAF